MPQFKKRRLSSSDLLSSHESRPPTSNEDESFHGGENHTADIDGKARREVYLDTGIPGIDASQPPLCRLSDTLCDLCHCFLTSVLTHRTSRNNNDRWTFEWGPFYHGRRIFKHYNYRYRLESSSEAGCELCSLLTKSLPASEDRNDSIVLFLSEASLRTNSSSQSVCGSFTFSVLPHSLLWMMDNTTCQGMMFHFIVAKNMKICLNKSLFVETSTDSTVYIPKLPSLDPYSSEAFDQIKSWYKACSASQHLMCHRSQTQLPRRLIDVFPRPSGQIDEYHQEEIVYLIETCSLAHKSATIPYVALSYCWGGWSGLMTKTTNLADLRAGVRLSKLPKVVQDAVYVCRNSDIRYLWVDSLCICQDNTSEWTEEVARIVDIYGGCEFVISALCSGEAGEGFLRSREFSPVSLGTVRSYYGTWSEDDELFVRQTPRSAGDEIELSPLTERAWTLQEKLIAPAVLHYGRDQMMWECNTEHLVSETGQREMKNEASLRISASTEVDTDIGRRGLWECLVEQYSRRKLTYSTDKLPAISGIVSALRREGIMHGSYLAGLWENSLEHQLMWRSDDIARSLRFKPMLPNPNIPTWSWAHLNHPVSTSESRNCVSALSRPARFHVGNDGTIKGKSSIPPNGLHALYLSGYVQSLEISALDHDSLPITRNTGMTIFLGLPGCDSRWWPDVVSLPDGEYFAIRVLHCPRISGDHNKTTRAIVYLILRRMTVKKWESAEDHFVRVGVLFLYKVGSEHFVEPYPDVRCKTEAPLLVNGAWKDIIVI